MISIDTWPPWVAIIVTGGWGLAGLAFSLYLSHRHLDAMKEALKNSRYIYLWGRSLGKRGFLWSLLEIAKIAGMVVWPRASIRIGEVDPVDIKNFPPHLKHLLVINLTLMTIAFAWLAIAAVLIKLR
ncbi:hypothetical protein ACN079_25385 [Pseudomonas sp. ABY48]|uniref:hypothetical protein n=1 Tax=Pseudomonas sp. ABY48 TaxID=3402865 RepID=UPI003B43640E